MAIVYRYGNNCFKQSIIIKFNMETFRFNFL